jgi:hypothetical protein
MENGEKGPTEEQNAETEQHNPDIPFHVLSPQSQVTFLHMAGA